MESHEKVMVFVDGSNIFHALRRLSVKIDYYKLVRVLVGDRVLVRPYFYSSTAVPQTKAQFRFHQALRYQGFTVVTRPVKTIHDDVWIEKGVDLALASDMLVSAFRDFYDTAVLISGDEDFVLVVDEIKRLGKRVEVAAFRSTIGKELETVADLYIDLDDLLEQIIL